MGELLLSVPRPRGPRIERCGAKDFHAIGVTETSPLFKSRAEGEIWLAIHLGKVAKSKRPRIRACMRCRAEFQSEGFHHRMCNSCRANAAGADTSAYRVIRPNSRG
ncbi:hypothetical protein [Cypionkella psychrotolerans]|uniref:hypothetical protein n=1 Tax=Cypionkella psychrotolerans TaxID=1678131 RepID=UPI0006B5EB50|nr:hypothetical protein [Cypionkella psychrotolerans]